VHGAAFAVESPAVRGAGPIGCGAAQTDADEQRAVEPATILIAAFKIEIGRPREPVFGVQGGKVAGAGIEPDVQNVVLFGEVG
jgi:hypothetical protein